MHVNYPAKLIRIAVAEDHVMYREALSREIDRWDNCKVIVQASNGRQLLELMGQSEMPDMLLLDLAMPEMNGYDTITAIRKRCANIRIIVLSLYSSNEVIWKTIASGANGFVAKTGDLLELKYAIVQVLHSGSYFSDQTAANFIKRAAHTGSIPKENHYSDIELSFLRHCCSEKTYKEIATEMGLTLRKLEYIRVMLFERFEVKSRTHMAILVKSKGIVL